MARCPENAWTGHAEDQDPFEGLSPNVYRSAGQITNVRLGTDRAEGLQRAEAGRGGGPMTVEARAARLLKDSYWYYSYFTLIFVVFI